MRWWWKLSWKTRHRITVVVVLAMVAGAVVVRDLAGWEFEVPGGDGDGGDAPGTDYGPDWHAPPPAPAYDPFFPPPRGGYR